MGEAARTAGGHSFRPEIQGLRALAILAVVAYHAHIPGVAGGFTGVDVFFVLSGYLICGLLNAELTASGSIDLTRFWLRRARRLLPNATLTLLATLLAGAIAGPAYAYPLLASGVAAAALYFANDFFAAKAVDYFAENDAPSPVLHFWSLSVEEQFYIAWPLLLAVLTWAVPRHPARSALYLMASLWIASLAFSLWAIGHSQPLAFYHTEARAWQLATGGLIAALEPRLLGRWTTIRQALGWLGLAGIAASAAVLDDSLAYPGLWAMLPTAAAAAVLIGSGSSLGSHSPARLLSLGPLRWIGDRSYSFYLWHWPALVLVPRLWPDLPLPNLFALTGAGLLATASYALVETPLRSGRLWPSIPWRGFAMASAGIAMVLAAGGLLAFGPLQAGKASAQWTLRLKQAAADRGRNIEQRCNLMNDEIEQPLCAYGDPTATRTVVLFGDSHAAQWFEAVDKVARVTGWRVLAWSKSACPAARITVWHKTRKIPFASCDAWRAGILARLTGADRPQMVMVASFVGISEQVWDADAQKVLSVADGTAAFRNGMRQTLASLHDAGIATVLIADTPQTYASFAECLAGRGGKACDRPRAEALPAYRPDVEAASALDVPVIDLSDRICNARTCPAIKNGMIVYRDRHHLTATFAASLADAFAPWLPKAAETPGVASADGPALLQRVSATPGFRTAAP